MYLQTHHLHTLWSLAAVSGNEICGVLLGRRAPQPVLDAIIPARNIHPAPRQHFLIDARTLLRADAQARAVGGEIIGFYHSHPSGSAMPSAHDRRDAWSGYLYLIVALDHGVPRYICAWRCLPDGVHPEPLLPMLADRA